jgi:predicted phosphodiesterase
MNKITIAILSDLHPTTSAAEHKSHLQMDVEELEIFHPVMSIRKLAENNNLKVDVVVCPGDFGNQSDPQSIKYGWQSLHKIKDYLGASTVIISPGNHDHDSRGVHVEFDPKYFLQSLEPKFPFSEHKKNTHFWAWHWAESYQNNCRFIVLNTSAYHGIKEEYCHGRVAPRTIEMIANHVNNKHSAINILVCHHHPVKNEDITGDYESMINGELLLSKLDQSNSGPWIIIHGHKHFPKIFYSQGTSDSPVIFSAASFSAYLHQEISARVGNQFHIMEIDIDKTNVEGHCHGEFRTWDWSSGIGWIPAPDEKGLPHKGGFGHRASSTKIASELAKLLVNQNLVHSEEIYRYYPDLKFVSPLDLVKVKDKLKNHHNVSMEISKGTVSSMGVSA